MKQKLEMSHFLTDEDLKTSADIQAERNEKERKIRERELNDIRRIIATPEGRRFYWRVLSMARTFRESFSAHDATTSYHEGRRSIGIQLFNDLMNASAEEFLKMRKEHMSDPFLEKSSDLKIPNDSYNKDKPRWD